MLISSKSVIQGSLCSFIRTGRMRSIDEISCVTFSIHVYFLFFISYFSISISVSITFRTVFVPSILFLPFYILFFFLLSSFSFPFASITYYLSFFCDSLLFFLFYISFLYVYCYHLSLLFAIYCCLLAIIFHNSFQLFAGELISAKAMRSIKS